MCVRVSRLSVPRPGARNGGRGGGASRLRGRGTGCQRGRQQGEILRVADCFVGAGMGRISS